MTFFLLPQFGHPVASSLVLALSRVTYIACTDCNFFSGEDRAADSNRLQWMLFGPLGRWAGLYTYCQLVSLREPDAKWRRGNGCPYLHLVCATESSVREVLFVSVLLLPVPA
eukprot:gnl/TRDRNA2_/TRDRNA2_177192_c1_seq6.p2 gnl/TRDRNA2_/TRDRNA2_177192_c1~~gnl/TRDRNA2_/TRDRNA2_177192_c1_seq6.p2  ORF type:complete len:112 (+),score=4.85 gnl/TRDRNA2_/TRDRNA2_177192_c1_seq6:10-345(+)